MIIDVYYNILFCLSFKDIDDKEDSQRCYYDSDFERKTGQSEEDEEYEERQRIRDLVMFQIFLDRFS